MGICRDCIYHSVENVSGDFSFRRNRFDNSHVCLCPENDEIDYITGAVKHANCYLKNCFEDCEYFDDGKQEVKYYAWKDSDDNIVYTLMNTPSAEDFVYDDLEKAPTLKVTSVSQFYAWADESNTVYTKSETPVVGDSTYTLEDAADKEITEVTDTTIKVEEVSYTRDSEKDVLNSIIYVDTTKYCRDEESDVTRREDIPEEDQEETETEDPTEDTPSEPTDTDPTDTEETEEEGVTP